MVDYLNSIFGCLYYLDVGSFTDISKVHVYSIFRIEMYRIISFLSQFSLPTVSIGRERASAPMFTHESFETERYIYTYIYPSYTLIT
jgi:hypothetical protein